MSYKVPLFPERVSPEDRLQSPVIRDLVMGNRPHRIQNYSTVDLTQAFQRSKQCHGGLYRRCSINRADMARRVVKEQNGRCHRSCIEQFVQRLAPLVEEAFGPVAEAAIGMQYR